MTHSPLLESVMKPLLAVQPAYRHDNQEASPKFAGSCFRLWVKNHFLTAAHCLEGIESTDISVFDYVQEKYLKCHKIYTHPHADLAIIEVEGRGADQLENFRLTDVDFSFGENVHCFGWLTEEDNLKLPARVIGGIIQRPFIHREGKYETPALEYSSPIPKGMSGGPAFSARYNDIAIGVAIGTIKSSVVVSEYTDYEDEKKKESEKISEIVRYGVILRLFELREWITETLPRSNQQ